MIDQHHAPRSRGRHQGGHDLVGAGRRESKRHLNSTQIAGEFDRGEQLPCRLVRVHRIKHRLRGDPGIDASHLEFVATSHRQQVTPAGSIQIPRTGSGLATGQLHPPKTKIPSHHESRSRISPQGHQGRGSGRTRISGSGGHAMECTAAFA